MANASRVSPVSNRARGEQLRRHFSPPDPADPTQHSSDCDRQRRGGDMGRIFFSPKLNATG